MAFGDLANWIFPQRAVKRQIARNQLARLSNAQKEIDTKRRAFETATSTRQRSGIATDNASPDTAIHTSAESLRGQVRHLEQNTGNVSGPIQRLVDNVVGDGIMYQSIVRADETTGRNEHPKINQKTAERFREESEWNFKLWSDQADMRLLHDWPRLQRLAFGSVLRDGGVLAVGRLSERRGRPIPYTIQLLEIDRLETPMDFLSDPKVRNGIRYDREGVPETYYALREHPGATTTFPRKQDAFEAIPAYFDNGNKKVIHLFNPIRPEQTIGYTIFASALKDLLDGDRYMDAEKMAALEDACMTAIFTTENPKGFVQNFADATGSKQDNFQQQYEFGTNQMWSLAPGQKADIHSPSRPNSGMRDYMEILMGGPANSMNIPPEVFSQNFKGLNYSNARTILLNLYAAACTWQRFLVTDLCNPVKRNVLSHFVSKGKIHAPGWDRRTEDYMAAGWIPAVFRRWLDPLKEAKGKEVDLINNMDNLTDIYAERGKDVNDELEKRARELKKMQDLEEEFDIKFPESTLAQPEVNGEAGADETRSMIDDMIEDKLEDSQNLRVV